MSTENISAIILTGGKNLRLGRNKALETVGGKSLLERVYERVSPIADEVIVVTSLAFTDIPIADKVSVVTDSYPEKGPLGGIFSGLNYSHSEKNIVVGTDMPFLNTALLGYLAELADGYDAVVPLFDDGMKEPLHAVYSKNSGAIIDERLRDGRLSVHAFIDALNVRYVEKEEVLRFDPELLSFFDINFQSDLDRAELIARERER